MRVFSLKEYGSVDGFVRTEAPVPQPRTNEVRVRVLASAFGPDDSLVAKGFSTFLHGRKFPLVLGYDFSGVIVAIGSAESRWKGAFGEFIIAHADEIALKPSNVSHAQAAAAATAGLTALQAIRDQGGLPKSDTRVLVTGVSGAVGSIGILVSQKLGAHVTVVGSKRGLDLARSFGVDADDLVDREQSDFFDKVKGPFDVIFDAAGVYRWSDWKGKLKENGTFVTTKPSFRFVIDKLTSLISTSNVQMVYVHAKTKDLELLADWLNQGLEIPIDSTFPVSQLNQAMAHYDKGNFLGRIVVDVESL